jgi:asparagine synthase (glutamine-hydrolysing)
MCGIAGVIEAGGRPVDRDALERMSASIAHRGPDGEGTHVDGPVGLAHRRLSIIDLAGGAQPMTADGVTIVFNGEIYNYIELRDELRGRGHCFETASDTEVVLRGYIERGPDVVHDLNGMFAFLIHDRRRGRVLAARDRLGIKPLYWWRGPDRVLFGSEIKALLAHGGVPAEPDLNSIKDYVTFQYVIGEGTLFRDVFKLLPGHLMMVDVADLSVRTVRWWDPSFVVEARPEHEYMEDVAALLVDAARLQVRSDVPVGAHLSGGLDSSLVTMLASRVVDGPIRVFTGAFDNGPEFDESPHAREVAAACGALYHEIRPTEDDFVDWMPRLVRAMDEPAAGPGLFPQYAVSRLAARHVKVVLGGQGGDEVFGGYARYIVAYLEQALKGAVNETNDEGEHIVSLVSILPNLPYLKAYVPMLREFWRDGVFGPTDRRYFRLVDRSGGALSCFSGDFRAGFEPESRFARFQTVFNHPDTLSFYNRMTHYDLVANLPALLQVEDRVSMAVSLESRVPLLDHRVVEMVARMPPAMKFKGGQLKYVLRELVREVLPPSIVARKDKMGFPVPLHLWGRSRAGAFIRDVLGSARCRGRGLFDAAELDRLVDSEAAFGRRLWGVLNLELWFREFIDAAA